MFLELLAQNSGFFNTNVAVSSFWVCVALMVIVPSVASYWHSLRKAEVEVGLKQQMVERGYSAEEILAVINNDAAILRKGKTKRGSMTPAKLPPEHVEV